MSRRTISDVLLAGNKKTPGLADGGSARAWMNRRQYLDDQVSQAEGGQLPKSKAAEPEPEPPKNRYKAVDDKKPMTDDEWFKAKFGYAHGGPADMRHGGSVPTAKRPGVDQVPAMLDAPPGGPAEYVLPGDTVAKVGVNKLDALVDATHNAETVERRRMAQRTLNDVAVPHLADGRMPTMITGGGMDPLRKPEKFMPRTQEAWAQGNKNVAEAPTIPTKLHEVGKQWVNTANAVIGDTFIPPAVSAYNIAKELVTGEQNEGDYIPKYNRTATAPAPPVDPKTNGATPEKVDGKTFSYMSGPGRGSMSSEDWKALPNEERIARNVKGYEDAAANLQRSRNQAIAAMDNRELDANGKLIPRQSVTIGSTGGYGILDNDYEMARRARMEFGDKKDENSAAKAATYLSGGKGAEAKMSDVIDALRLQETSDYHNKSLGLEAQKSLAEQSYRQRQNDLDSQRTTANVAQTAQKMSDSRRKALNEELTASGLSEPLSETAKMIAARIPGLDPSLILATLGEISGTESGEPSGFWGLGGKQKYGDLKEFSPMMQSEVLKKFNDRIAQLSQAQGK